MGGSVIADDTTIHVEVAHVPLADALNPLGQETPCGVEGRAYVCVERVAAARAGIEDIWRQQTGELADGRTLGQKYEEGDPLATTLYETSAMAIVHAIAGVMERYGFPDPESVFVLHGGNFEIARYRDAVTHYMEGFPGPHPRLVFSRDLSANVCLDGAAVLGALAPERSPAG
jgi:predicted NBD/HSP70 family sugar kinase